MPELPEVETVVRTLEHMIKDTLITGVEVRYPKAVENVDPAEFTKRLEGQHFRVFSRRGKYLIFGMDDVVMVAHMRMEGKFYVTKDPALINRHVHIVFTLQDGRMVLYHDTRKFGRFDLYEKDEPLTVLEHLGPEPFDEAVTREYLDSVCSPNRCLKELLLDQGIIAGIGNIYANEVCFAIKRRPSVRWKYLTRKNKEELIIAARRILNEAIAAGGTTIRSYTSQLGVTGLFQLQVHVHGREKEPCHICGNPIKKVQLKGRGTYYCPVCQK